jgi:hypothetical protein
MNIKSIKSQIHRRYFKEYANEMDKHKHLPLAYRVWDEVDACIEEMRAIIWRAAK